jgi:hypothetical protein
VFMNLNLYSSFTCFFFFSNVYMFRSSGHHFKCLKSDIINWKLLFFRGIPYDFLRLYKNKIYINFYQYCWTDNFLVGDCVQFVFLNTKYGFI